jgi:hypothetical protein
MRAWAPDPDLERDTRELLDRIKAREASEAREAHRQAERELAADRKRAYARAQEAARAWQLAARANRIAESARTHGTCPKAASEFDADEALRHRAMDAVLQEPIERLRRHVVDLAAEEPPIDIRWLAWGTRSQQLVGTDNGVAIFDRNRTVLIEPVRDEPTYAVAIHEIAHHRAKRSSRTLRSEVAAWAWAKEHALVWTEACQQRMVKALGSYAAAAGDSANELLDLLELERLCSRTEYARERQRRLEREIAAEEAHLSAALADRRCGECQRAAASVLEGGRYYCARCAATMRQRVMAERQREKDAKLNEEIARLREWKRTLQATASREVIR